MALIDPRTDAVVIRIVYDGAPLAGKSTSVGMLGAGLGGKVFSPEEVNGRTLYFDWLDYTGGLFEGRRIRCQIVSVPGQATLAPRRRRLLQSADAVVFVGDTSPEGFEADRGYLRGLCSVLAQVSGPPVGIVLQANKRDHPEAVPIESVRSMLDELGMRVGVMESVAPAGNGIRETFVFAVRLALDRVRELMRLGQLQSLPPAVDSAQDLLNELQRVEEGAMDLAAATKLTHTRLSDVRRESVASLALAEAVRDNEEPSASATAVRHGEAWHGKSPAGSAPQPPSHVPSTPGSHVASGFIWPPVDGRTILHELTTTPISLSRSEVGDWSGVVNGRWKIASPAASVFSDLEEGRFALVQAARVQSVGVRGAPIERALVLAPDGAGRYRLWQIDRLGSAAAESSAPGTSEMPP